MPQGVKLNSLNDSGLRGIFYFMGKHNGLLSTLRRDSFTYRVSLKSLPDNAAFKFSTGSHIVYRLQSLDHKKRIATYTSEASKRTYKAGWGKEVMV